MPYVEAEAGFPWTIHRLANGYLLVPAFAVALEVPCWDRALTFRTLAELADHLKSLEAPPDAPVVDRRDDVQAAGDAGGDAGMDRPIGPG